MGTSKANIGPRGTTNPVPEWVADFETSITPTSDGQNDDENNEDDQEQQKTDNLNWREVRRSFNEFTKDSSKSNFKRFTSNYRKASGGKKGLAKSASGGRKGAIMLVDFLNILSSNGLEKTIEKYSLGDLKNLTAEGAINEISKIFIEIDGTDEGSSATSAAIETINKIYIDHIENPDAVDSLNNESISDYLEFYISTYIFERISLEITKTLEDKDFSGKQVSKMEAEIDLFIKAEVQLEFNATDFSNMNIKKKNVIIQKIFENAYDLI